jgi:hypothetical protein
VITLESQYATLLLAMLLGYEWSGPEFSGSLREYLMTFVALLFSLCILAWVPWLTFTGLRWAEGLAGGVLTFYAWRAVQRGALNHHRWLSALDAASTWLALVLAGAEPLAIAAGALSGLALPLAIGPWPDWLRRMSRMVETVWLGAVGLRTMLAALLLLRIETIPLWIWTIPWLVIWDRFAYRDAI